MMTIRPVLTTYLTTHDTADYLTRYLTEQANMLIHAVKAHQHHIDLFLTYGKGLLEDNFNFALEPNAVRLQGYLEPSITPEHFTETCNDLVKALGALAGTTVKAHIPTFPWISTRSSPVLSASIICDLPFDTHLHFVIEAEVGQSCRSFGYRYEPLSITHTSWLIDKK